jgi:Flp pilus assembly protein TadG
MGRRSRSQQGAVLVEFALALPLLVAAGVFGLAVLWAAFVQVAAGQAAREGARYASVALPPTYRTHPDAAAVVQRVRAKVPVLRLSAGDVTVVPAARANGPVTVTVRKALPGLLHGIAVTASSTGEARAE